MAGRVLFIFLCLFFVRLQAEEENKLCVKNGTSKKCSEETKNAADVCVNRREELLKKEEKEYIVKTHNVLRENLTSGTYEKLPKAFYIKKILWNDKLASIAQTWAKQCQKPKGHSRNVDDVLLGFNVAVIEGGHRHHSHRNSVERLMKVWLDGLDHLTPELVASYEDPKADDYDFAAVSQMIWWNTTQMGCGRSVYNVVVGCRDERAANCSRNRTMVELVCVYFPAGNKPGEPVYTNEMVNTLLCHFEKKETLCRPLNKSDYKGDLSRPRNKSYEYRIRSRMIELWPAANGSFDVHLSPRLVNFYFFILFIFIYFQSIDLSIS